MFEICFSVLYYCPSSVPESCLPAVALMPCFKVVLTIALSGYVIRYETLNPPCLTQLPSILKLLWHCLCGCKKAKLQARIKPTVLCSAIDKENSIEFLLDLLHYIYNYYHGYAPCLPWSSCYSSADFFVICCDCDLWLHVTWPFCDHCHTFCDSVTVIWYFLCSTLVII